MTRTSLDYYAIEELLTNDEHVARDRARRFVQEEVMQEIVSCHRAGTFPEHLTPRMGALGFYAPYLKEHGCAGQSYTAYGLIMQELERADSGLRSLASVQGPLAIHAIHSFGTPEQHARWLPGLVSGERVACFALTELGHGSDPAGMETRAIRDGDRYLSTKESLTWGDDPALAFETPQPEAFREQLREAGSPRASAEWRDIVLPAIKAPTLVIWGECDTVCSREDAEFLARKQDIQLS